MYRGRVVTGFLLDPVKERCLVGLRPGDRALPFVWELPGGKVNQDKFGVEIEDIKEALVREWREELGVEVEVGSELWKKELEFPEGIWKVYLYQVFLPAPQSRESLIRKHHAALSWEKLEELATLPSTPSMADILPVLREQWKLLLEKAIKYGWRFTPGL